MAPELMHTAPKDTQILAWIPEVEDWYLIKWSTAHTRWEYAGDRYTTIHPTHWAAYNSTLHEWPKQIVSRG